MRYKVGDKVKVREWDDMMVEFGTDEDGDIKCRLFFVADMKNYCGEDMTVSGVSDVSYKMEEDHGYYVWTDDMLCES